MAELKDCTVYRGDDQVLRFTMTTNGSVAGWTTQFTARRTTKTADPPLLAVAGVVVNAGSASTPGVFEVTLTKALLLTLDPRVYVYTFKRTNADLFAVLTEGTMIVKADVFHAVS